MAYVGMGTDQLNAFGKRLKEDYNADAFLFSYKDSDDNVADRYYEAVIKR